MHHLDKGRIAIIGGGPSALFIFKRLVESGRRDLAVHIFERGDRLGQGMPYSPNGANLEHITNVSGNELPDLAVPLTDWVRALPKDVLEEHDVDGDRFNQSKVLPRLLFGRYLEEQFHLYIEQAISLGIETVLHFGSHVTDISDLPEVGRVEVEVEGKSRLAFEHLVICTGHNWPKKQEGKVPGYFDSPYPPAKLAQSRDHAVALRGSALTAVDAIRTLSRANGRFARDPESKSLRFEASNGSESFRIVMHTRSGLLPCVRFHLEDPQVSDEGLLQQEDWQAARERNDGFVPLDLMFDEDFKKPLREKDPEFYQRIKDLTMEQFVALMMERRERSDPFAFFRAEYDEALESLAKKKSILWKEVLAILSFALNYPAKHFSAEDTLRMQKVLQPLITLVIAFIPQGSCEELIALHEAGRLDLVMVGDESKVEPVSSGGVHYHYTSEDGEELSPFFSTYVDCIGQSHMPVKAFPFPSLIRQGVVRQARIEFRSPEAGQQHQSKHPDSVERDSEGHYHLIVAGIAINDGYQPLDWADNANPRLHIMAVPYIGGHNPDYSGLDFCEEGSQLIVDAMLGLDKSSEKSAGTEARLTARS